MSLSESLPALYLFSLRSCESQQVYANAEQSKQNLGLAIFLGYSVWLLGNIERGQMGQYKED